MIYFFTGKPNSGKTTLGKMLAEFLKTERRNWRKPVFYIDESDIQLLFPPKTDDYLYENCRNSLIIS
jgi:tRNA uridine 5-carbamoylmethylation protein Kti12